jgi:hypothetical protein
MFKRLAPNWLIKIAGIFGRGPLTAQTGVVLIFCCYLLLGPVPNHSDIISASLAYGLLTIVSIIVVATTIQAALIKRALKLTLYPPDAPVLARSSCRSVLLASRIWLIPGTTLECQLRYAHPGAETPLIKLYKGWREDRRIAVEQSFPHRGNWEVTEIECAVRDLTGFARLSWRVPIQSSIVVAPIPQPEALLPLVSSTQRAGDLVTDTVHRQGDPFDIKPYHPSDGLKKIVWKAFAKSGQLLSRHPEASMTPEGFVALFVIADGSHDQVCGKAVSYVTALKELKLDILLGCQGQSGRPFGSDAESTQTLLIDSVWDAKDRDVALTIDDLQALLDSCVQSNSGVNVRRMVIFIDGARLAAPSGLELLDSLSNWLDTHAIEPVFFVSQPSNFASPQSEVWYNKALNLVLEPARGAAPRVSAADYQRFLSTCVARQWEVYV